jgi:hypothetical protein
VIKVFLILLYITSILPKIRTVDIICHGDIYFPIVTILDANKFYDVLDFSTVFGKHKKNGININDLLKALVNYKHG